MRRLPKSPLLASLSRSLLRHRAPLPLLHPPPPRPRLLPFSTRTLSTLPPPDAASTAKPDGLAFLEAGELQESTSDHQKAFDLALKALGPLQESHGGWSVPVARALRLAGAAASRLGLLSDSLESLNAAADIVDSLEGGDAEVAKVGAAVHEQLARTKTAMGRRWDAMADLQRALELKGGFLKEGSAELGDAYRDVAEAYVGVLGFEKALPLCLKALEIAEKRCGEGTTEVAKVRRLLMVVYTGLGRNEEALEQNELAKMVYDRLGLDVELSPVEIDGANVRILLGRSEEAMSDLKRVMQRANKESEERALAFVTMAKILCSQERFCDSKRCLEIALGILDSKGAMSPGRVAEAYAEIAMLYESMTEFEMSLCLMKKILAFLEGVSEMQHIQGSISARMGWLLLHTKRFDEAVPYLERAVEKLKNCFGPLHFGLGFAYKHLGEAYIDMDQPQSAVKFLALASDIIDATFGPKHEDSIDTNQSLANAHGLMGRLLPLYFPRDKHEEEIASLKLPADVGDENGETIIDERKIRIKPLPAGATNSKSAVPVPVDIPLSDSGLTRRRNSFKLDSYLDPAFMSIIKDPDLRRKEQWEKSAQANKGFNCAKLLGFGDLGGPPLSAAEEYSLHSRYLAKANSLNLSEIAEMKIIYRGGVDSEGRLVMVVVGAHFLLRCLDLERFVLFVIKEFESLIQNPYTIVYFHSAASVQVQPDLGFMKRLQQILGRKHRRNLRAIYVLHPTLGLRTAILALQLFVDGEVWKKVVYVDRLVQLFRYVPREQLTIPDFVFQHDLEVNGGKGIIVDPRTKHVYQRSSG